VVLIRTTQSVGENVPNLYIKGIFYFLKMVALVTNQNVMNDL
jgi:hypothetical protein